MTNESNPAAAPAVAVIMAGGSGERFWPLSRRERPKQLLRLTSPRETLLEEAVNRIRPLIPAERIFVSTSTELLGPIRAAGLGIPAENIIAEPCRRNTAGCLCWVAASLKARYPGEDPVLAILTADHRIGEPEKFRRCVSSAVEAARKEQALVTIGIAPLRPETGYGYIEAGAALGDGLFEVERFREKPNLEQAEDFVASGNFSWNSGMFFWRLSSFEAELSTASPDHARATAAIAAALSAGDEARAGAAFEGLENISIDYALLERARRVLMVRAAFPWDDVGAWDALDRSRSHDEHGNVAEGDPVLINVEDSIIVNEAPGRMAVGVVGLDNVIVIVTGDAVLVVPKDRAQEVRQIARELARRKAPQV